MRIAIVGVGAVGGYFGGRLAESGMDVTFVARGNTLNKLVSEGLKIYSPNGNIILSDIKATDHPTKVGTVDVIIIAVKAWQVPEVAELLTPMMNPNTAILPLQNGVEASNQIVAFQGQEHVLGGICRISAYKSSFNEIKHVDVEPLIALGELDNTKSNRVLELVKILKYAKIAAEIPSDIHSAIWQKFLFIAPVSGVGAVTRSPIGTVRKIPESRNILKQAMEEVYSIAIAKGIVLARDAVQKTLAFLDNMAAATIPSMQRDIIPPPH